MDAKIKKKLVKNWFKILQDIICKDIEELEGKKTYLNRKHGSETKIKMKVVENLEFLKMEKYLKRLV